MDITSFFFGTLSSLVATAICWYGAKKRRGYGLRKIEQLEFEKERIQAFAENPVELYRESLAGLFYLILIISFANITRLFHGLLYDGGIVWQHVFIEGSLWGVVGYLSIRYKKRIDGAYDIKASTAILDEQIARLKRND